MSMDLLVRVCDVLGTSPHLLLGDADKARAVSLLQVQYETEKKEQEIVLLGKDKEVQAKEIQKQKLVRNGFIGGFALVALFYVFAFSKLAGFAILALLALALVARAVWEAKHPPDFLRR